MGVVSHEAATWRDLCCMNGLSLGGYWQPVTCRIEYLETRISFPLIPRKYSFIWTVARNVVVGDIRMAVTGHMLCPTLSSPGIIELWRQNDCACEHASLVAT